MARHAEGTGPPRRARQTIAFVALVGAAIAALTAMAQAQTESPQPPPDRRPNVVLIMTDDQTLASMRVMSRTKRLIGDAGTTFSNAHVSFSLCCPSRATFLTGQYAHNHDVLDNLLPNGGFDKLDHTNTLPEWLADSGYATSHVGKYLNRYGIQTTQTFVPEGWTDWHGLVDPSTYKYYGFKLNHNGKVRGYGTRPDLYQSDILTRTAIESIQKHAPGPKPFFLSLGYLAPHFGGPTEPEDPTSGFPTPAPAERHKGMFKDEPLPRPPNFNEEDVSDKPSQVQSLPRLTDADVADLETYNRQTLQTLQAVDEGVEKVIAALQAAGELENTIVMFTSDNAFFGGEHRFKGGKVSLYDPSLRIPLLVRGPGVPAGRTRGQLVSNVDLAASVLDAADATPGLPQDGRSFLPLARDPASVDPSRDILFETKKTAILYPDPKDPTKKIRPIAATGIRTAEWFYIEWHNGARELYDLRNDPHQLQSRHADPALATLRGNLSRRLRHLKDCRGADCSRRG